jgi:hypothetical protein
VSRNNNEKRLAYKVSLFLGLKKSSYFALFCEINSFFISEKAIFLHLK